MFRSLLKWTDILDFDLFKIIRTVVPKQWLTLCYCVWIEAKVGLTKSLQQETIENLWTAEETSCLH